MLRRIAPLLLLAPPTSLAAQQAQDTARVSPVVVTATRTPLTQGALPVAVTIITAEELRLRGVTTVAEAMRDVTSAYVAQSGSQGSQTSLFFRGGESKYVKVLVDGVPVNDPGGFYDWSSLTTDNVERIEIVRGPASVVHGADAVTGVVHVITKRGRGNAAMAVDLRTGRASRADVATIDPEKGVRTVDFSTDVSGASDATSYAFGLARHETSGLYELNNLHYNNVLSGRVDLAPSPRTRVRMSLRYNDTRFNYPTSGGGDIGDPNANRTEDRTVIGLEMERDLSATVRASLTINSAVNDGTTDDPADSSADASSLIQDKMRRRGADLRVQWLPSGKLSATLGLAAERQDYRQMLQAVSSFGPFLSSFSPKRSNVGLYGEAVVTPVSDLTATLGVRLDENDAFGTFRTYRAGASYRPLAATRVRATVGNAFREPTFLENYSSGFATGNPNLEAERTKSWDVGVDQEVLGGRVTASATYFAQRFQNMIDYDPTDACGFSYCNVAEATANGLEVESRGRVVGALWAGIAATYLKTEVVKEGIDTTVGGGGLYRRGESLIRRPHRKIAGDLTYRAEKYPTLSLRVQQVAERTDRDFRPYPSTSVVLPGYTRVDLGADYSLSSIGWAGTSLTLRIENLADEEYQNVFNFLAPRRTLVLGVRSVF